MRSSPVVRGFGVVAALVTALMLACPGAEPTTPTPTPNAETPAPPAVTPPATPGADAPPADPPDDVAPPPMDRSCAVDDDCVLSALEVKDGRCCIGCLVDPTNKRWKEEAEDYCKDRYGPSCPKKRCGSALSPKCRAGQCN